MGHCTGCWPMKSQALAVHPEQIAEAHERNRKAGITGVEYLKDGTAVIADRGARKNLMKLEGVVDKEAGYGDTYAGSSSLPYIPPEPGADEFTDAGPQKDVQERNVGYTE